MQLDTRWLYSSELIDVGDGPCICVSSVGSVPFRCCVAFRFVFVLFSDFSFIFVFLFLAFDVLGIVRVEEGVDDDHNCYITPGTGEH